MSQIYKVSKALPIQRKAIAFHSLYTSSIHPSKPGIFLYFLPQKHLTLTTLANPNLSSFFSVGNLSNTTFSSDSLMISYFPKDKIKTHLSISQASVFSLSSLHTSSLTLGSNTHLLAFTRLLNFLWSVVLCCPFLGRRHILFYFPTQS